MAGRKQVARILPFVGFGLLLAISVFVWAGKSTQSNSKTIQFKDQSFDVYTVKDASNIVFGYTDSAGNQLRTFDKFKSHIGQSSFELVFAVNGGMFTKSFEPLGLFIDKNIEVTPLKLDSGYGNFYLEPNGVFGVDVNRNPFVEQTKAFRAQRDKKSIKYATQSGPMLVINNNLHPVLNEGSKNLHIRNGVGVDKNGHIVFVISNQKTNFFDFASLFRDVLDCANALYLDGAISKMYNQEIERVEDGKFGVMIGVVKQQRRIGLPFSVQGLVHHSMD